MQLDPHSGSVWSLSEAHRSCVWPLWAQNATRSNLKATSGFCRKPEVPFKMFWASERLWCHLRPSLVASGSSGLVLDHRFLNHSLWRPWVLIGGLSGGTCMCNLPMSYGQLPPGFFMHVFFEWKLTTRHQDKVWFSMTYLKLHSQDQTNGDRYS